MKRNRERVLQCATTKQESGDCQAGVYDKWYRYNAANDGMAYDLGWTEQNKTTQNGVVRFIDA